MQQFRKTNFLDRSEAEVSAAPGKGFEFNLFGRIFGGLRPAGLEAGQRWDRWRLFFVELARNPKAMGAVCASSAALGHRIACHVPAQGIGSVVELGGGTGAVTQSILRHGIGSSRLIVIEQSERMANHLCRRFPNIRVVHGDAAQLEGLIEGTGPIDAIVSGLPLCSMPKRAVEGIVASCARNLPDHAVIIQFTYLLCKASPWLEAGLRKIGRETVWSNLPPAKIEVFAR